MKKSEKIVIGILVVILISIIAITFIPHEDNVGKIDTNIPSGNSEQKVEENNKKERIIMVKGTLYYDTGKSNNETKRCGTLDGNITSVIAEGEIPNQDGQANFTGARGYQYGIKENAIEVSLENEGWIIFEARAYTFYGTIKEATISSILVEPKEGEEIRKSADLISIGLGEKSDMIYQVGQNVKITYDGYVMESYPAQVKATKIELKSAENFEIKIYDKTPETNKKIHKIVDASETDKYDYSIYAWDVNVNIVINGEEISLRDALLQNKITMNEIISKANKDIQNPVTYKDGGTIEYHYNLYTIIKMHTLEGKRDVYIGMPEMTLNSINEVE